MVFYYNIYKETIILEEVNGKWPFSTTAMRIVTVKSAICLF